jgi:hypothetical protein
MDASIRSTDLHDNPRSGYGAAHVAFEAFEREDYGTVLKLASPHAVAGNSDAQCITPNWCYHFATKMPTTPTLIAQIDKWKAAKSETEHLEFKEARDKFESYKLLEYCVALANENENGSVLLLGVASTYFDGFGVYQAPATPRDTIFFDRLVGCRKVELILVVVPRELLVRFATDHTKVPGGCIVNQISVPVVYDDGCMLTASEGVGDRTVWMNRVGATHRDDRTNAATHFCEQSSLQIASSVKRNNTDSRKRSARRCSSSGVETVTAPQTGV